MEKFYIFLDIDGVINHYNWLKKYYFENLKKEGFHQFFCPENIEALNKLLCFLTEKNYQPKIVLSSNWRILEKRYELCKKLLIKYGLNYDDDFDKTCIKYNGHRGKQILEFMSNKNITDNFVIIDDEMRDISPYFDDKNLIKTSGLFKRGITEEQIINFIKKHFLDYKDLNEIYCLF